MDLINRETFMSVTEATGRGAALFRDAESGHDVVISRHGRPVAAVIAIDHLAAITSIESDLRSAAVVVSRLLADSGERHDLDAVISSFGYDRADLEAELDADLAAGRD